MRVTCPKCKNIIAEQVGDTIIFRSARGNGAIVPAVLKYECGKCGHTWEPNEELKGELNHERMGSAGRRTPQSV